MKTGSYTIRCCPPTLPFVCGMLAFAALAVLGGCAVGFTQGGTAVVGLPVGEPDLEHIKDTASGVGGAIGSLFGPGGGVIGSGIGETVAMALAGLFGWRSISNTNKHKDQAIEARDMAKANEDKAYDEGYQRGLLAGKGTPA